MPCAAPRCGRTPRRRRPTGSAARPRPAAPAGRSPAAAWWRTPGHSGIPAARRRARSSRPPLRHVHVEVRPGLPARGDVGGEHGGHAVLHLAGAARRAAAPRTRWRPPSSAARSRRSRSRGRSGHPASSGSHAAARAGSSPAGPASPTGRSPAGPASGASPHARPPRRSPSSSPASPATARSRTRTPPRRCAAAPAPGPGPP